MTLPLSDPLLDAESQKNCGCTSLELKILSFTEFITFASGKIKPLCTDLGENMLTVSGRGERRRKKHESVLAVKIPKNRHFDFDFDRSMKSVKRAAYEECGFDIIMIYKKKKITEAEDLTLTGERRPVHSSCVLPRSIISCLALFRPSFVVSHISSSHVCVLYPDAPARVFLTWLSQQTAPHSARAKQQASLCSSPPHCSLCFPARKTLAPRLHAKWNERRKKRGKWPQAESCYMKKFKVSSSSPTLFHWCNSDRTSPPSGRSRQRINPKYSVFF